MIHATIDTFEEEVIKQKGLVLVDFWAQWCGPCQMIAPILAEIDEEGPDVKVCKVDVDANMGLAQSYKVVAIPFLILFRDGEVQEKLTGLQSKKDLMDMIKKYKA